LSDDLCKGNGSMFTKANKVMCVNHLMALRIL
jgi:hypothetical protein